MRGVDLPYEVRLMKETPHRDENKNQDKRDATQTDGKMRVWYKGNAEDTRMLKGEELEKSGSAMREGEHWYVHSQSQNRNYVVSFIGDQAVCTCPDFERRYRPCKHIMAVKIAMRKEGKLESGVDVTVHKVTYSQDWPSYDKAQTNEKRLFMWFLQDLLKSIDDEERGIAIRGRKPIPLRDMIFASALKVYTTFSLRRFTTDIKEAMHNGYVSHAPYFTTISAYMNKLEMEPALQKLIGLSAIPLTSIETEFATDSTGVRTTRFTDYFDEKHHVHREHRWRKLHITCGVKTNIVTAVEVSDESGADSPYFIFIAKKTHEIGFKIEEMSADKAYSSRNNLNYIDKLGGVPFIPFKSNATGKPMGSRIYRKMYDFYTLRQEEFMDHYHKRSNVESTNSMIKSKFTDIIRSKNGIAQINEVLLKVLCHNIVVLIQSMYELGIEPEFLN